jgi:uroporphyrinogen III methyltransferase/synthase
MHTNFLQDKQIIITRSAADNKFFEKKLEAVGANVYDFPCITTTVVALSEETMQLLINLEQFTWIIFTSVKTVKYFMKIMQDMQVDEKKLRRTKIAAVGLATAQEVEKYKLAVSFIPAEYTTQQLVSEMKQIKNTTVLLPQSDIASKKMITDLKEKGAKVTDIVLYKTEFITQKDPICNDLLGKKEIDYITFTSSSTVKGFIQRVGDTSILQKAFTIPVISIGSVTTKTAKEYGFQKIYTARFGTTDGIIQKLQELV